MIAGRIATAKKIAVSLLVLLSFLLVISLLPIGDNDGKETGLKGTSNLMLQLEEINSLPPSVDAKIDPAVKEQMKEAVFAAAAARSGEKQEEMERIEVLVKASKPIGEEIRDIDGRILNNVDSLDGKSKYFAVEAGADRIAELASSKEVISVAPRTRFYAMLDQSVPLIKAASFWNAGYNGNGTRVAVLDTGIDKNHPMLVGKVIAEKDFTNSGSTNDKYGHGTHVAGIIAGSKANGGLYDGVATSAQLMNAKVLDDAGSGTIDSIIAGLKWAVDPDNNAATKDGANIVSMSLGAPTAMNSNLEDELETAVSKGVIVVTASGNCGNGCPDARCGSFRGVTMPGSSPSVITIGAVDNSRNIACFSGGGSVAGVGIKPDFVAPGVGIKSSIPGGAYVAMSGTSMATPHVSGAVALLLSKNSQLKHEDIRRVLEKTSFDLGDIGKDAGYGFGLVDLEKALVYREGIEFKIGLERQIVSGSTQKINVTVFDDVPVNRVTAAITRPDGTKADVEMAKSAGSSNVYTSDFTDTAKLGNYLVDVAVNYGGGGGSSGIEGGSGSGVQTSTVNKLAAFRVVSLLGDFGNIDEINISKQHFLSKNMTGSLVFGNTATQELNVSITMQLLDNITIMQEIRLPTTAVSAKSREILPVNRQFEVGPANYTLKILTDYGTGSIVNGTDITVDDDLPPDILNISYSKQLANSNNPQTFVIKLSEHSDLLNVALARVEKADSTLINTNHTTRMLTGIGKEKELALTIFDGLRDDNLYEAQITVCDENRNCATSGTLSFNVSSCSGKQLLVAKTYEQEPVFEKAATADSSICLSVLNRTVTTTPPSTYLEKFDAVIWSTGTDLVNIDNNDAAALINYHNKKGKLVVEGSDVAFKHGNDELMHTILRSELKNDLGFTVASAGNQSSPTNFSMNLTMPHPLVKGLESPILFNATVDPFPDAVNPYNGSVELAAWSGTDAAGSAMVVYENGSTKTFFMPFSISALNASTANLLASNAISWLLEESAVDIKPANIRYGIAIDGQQLNATSLIYASGQLPANPSVAVFADGQLTSQGVSDKLSEGTYGYNFTVSLKKGLRQLRVVANSGFSIKESNYVNNVKEYNLTVYPKEADLLLSGLAYSYADKAGSIVVNLSASNFGGTAATSAVTAYLEGKEAAKQEVGLAAGETKQLRFELKSPKGAYRFSATIDTDKAIQEYNESNNDLAETIYLCSKERILVVDDNDAEFFSTPEPSSAGVFLSIMRNNGYCVEGWDEAEQGTPSTSALSTFEAVVWSAGDYFNGTLSSGDLAAISGYGRGILLEGADLGLDHPDDELFQEITAAAFNSDMLLNESQPEPLTLKNHSITANISGISISKEKSPYPDSVDSLTGEVVAEWQSGKAAITANPAPRKAVYYAFSVDGVTDNAVMEKLVLNTLEWLLEKQNNAPQIYNLTNISVAEGEKAAIVVNASDGDGDNLTYSVNDTRFEQNGTNIFVWQTTHNDSGTYQTNVTVSDGTAASSQNMNITVLEVNIPPTVLLHTSDGSNISPTGFTVTMREGETKNFSVIAFDPDNDTLTYTWLLNGTVVSTAQNFTFAPKYNESGTYNLTIIVSDGKAEARIEITLIVFDTMDCDPGKQQKLCSLQLGVCQGSAVVCSGEGLWPACSADSYKAYNSSYEVEEKNCDSLDNDCDGLVDEGRICNRPPSLSSAGNRTVNENSTLEIRLNASDPDNDPLLFTLETPVSMKNVTFDKGNFSWAPTFDDAGAYWAAFNVSDGIASAAERINITVLDVNRPPYVSIIEDAHFNGKMNEGESAYFEIVAADPDDDALTYKWLLNNTLFSTAQNFTFAPKYNESGTYNLTIIVSDGKAEVGVEKIVVVLDTMSCEPSQQRLCSMQEGVCRGSFEVCTGNWPACSADSYKAYNSSYEAMETICDGLDNDCDGAVDEGRLCNTPPILHFIGNRTSNENSILGFALNATDAEGDELYFNATSLPRGAAFSNSTAFFSWTPDFDQAGSYTVAFTVSDALLSDLEAVNITVLNVNRPPVITGVLIEPSGLIMREGESKTFTAFASGEQGSTLRFIWEFDTMVALVSTQTYTYTAAYNHRGTHTLDLIVSNGDANSSEQLVITVLEALPAEQGQGCSSLLDGLCPSSCAAGSDTDCCVNAGLCWFTGYGCYDCTSILRSCSDVSDGVCPANCAAGSDADCCSNAGKYWFNNYGCYDYGSVMAACTTVTDGICPADCAAGSDYDCCTNSGSCWFSGYGCYRCGSTLQRCSDVADGVCPANCAAGADYDCCVSAGECWRDGGCYDTCDVIAKPQSTGSVKVAGRKLLVDGNEFIVKGVGYSPVPISSSADWGYDVTVHPELWARDFPLLRAMNATAIRTWGKVGSAAFLDAAWNNGNQPLRVIMGYWMGPNRNYEDPLVRQSIIDEFKAYVTAYKDKPAVLMWAIGNEENYFYANRNNTKHAAYFSLVNEMSRAAYDVEGPAYHPVAAVALEMPGRMDSVGNAAGGADDASTPFVDIWAINHYPGKSFGNFFTSFAAKTSKPLLIAEYGIDSLNNTAGTEYEPVQAEWNTALWREIVTSNVTIGGSVMSYSDEWWKDFGGNAAQHDFGGYPTTSQPDGYANEEWWGLMRVAKSASDRDTVTPKQAYYSLRSEFSNPKP